MAELFRMSALNTFQQYALEVSFNPVDPEKISLGSQKGTAFVIQYLGKKWLVTNLHNTEEETTEPEGNLDKPLIIIHSPKGGMFDLRFGRKHVFPVNGNTPVDVIAIEIFDEELPDEIRITPLKPFEWGGVATALPTNYIVPNFEAVSLAVSRYYIGVGFPGNTVASTDSGLKIVQLVHNGHLPVPHNHVHSYMPPMGKGASGGPIFELLSDNQVMLRSVHTYSYSSGLTLQGVDDVTVPTGGGVMIQSLLDAIDKLYN